MIGRFHKALRGARALWADSDGIRLASGSSVLKSLWSDTEGSALLEATIILPVLASLFFGVYEFSWYFNRQQLLEIGVRDAARYLAAASTNPCSDATLTANAKRLATTGTTAVGGTARVAGWATTHVTITCPSPFNNSSGTYNGPATIYTVNVTTSFPYPSLGFFGHLILNAAPNLRASHSQRAIGGAV